MQKTNEEEPTKTSMPDHGSQGAGQPVQTKSKKSKASFCIIAAIIIILGAILLGIFGFKACTNLLKSDNNEKTVDTKLTQEELNKYDGKALNISSVDGKVSGTAALTKTEKGTLNASFRIFINDEIPANLNLAKCHPLDIACQEIKIAYHYVGVLQNSVKARVHASPLLKRNCLIENKDFDPFDDYSPTCLESKPDTAQGIESTSFEMGLARTFKSIDEIFDISYLEVHDARDALVNECEQEGNQTNCSSSLDREAGEKGPILKTYQIELSDE